MTWGGEAKEEGLRYQPERLQSWPLHRQGHSMPGGPVAKDIWARAGATIVVPADIVDSVRQADVINSVKIEGDSAGVLAATADRVAEWNKPLDASG